jgi:hypothetical protein
MKRWLPVLHLLLGGLFLSAPLWADDPQPGEELPDKEEVAPEVKLKDRPKPPDVIMKVEECFKVHWLLRADDAHYWADWVSECPYTIDSVYVMVGFVDHGKKSLGNGVWPMYFVLPGAHQVTRFSAPADVSGFETMVVHHITVDSAEAFSQDRNTVQTVQQAHTVSASSGTLGDTGIGRIIPAK